LYINNIEKIIKKDIPEYNIIGFNIASLKLKNGNIGRAQTLKGSK